MKYTKDNLMPFDEIAAELGLSIKKVRKIHDHAIRKIRHHLKYHAKKAEILKIYIR